jgi:beta-lactamase class C
MNTRTINFMLLCLALSSFLGITRGNNNSRDNISFILEKDLQEFIQKQGIPGIAVALHTDGNDYLFHMGVVEKDTHNPVNNHTIFEIGSISKIFVALVCLLEIAEGAMKLDNPIIRYIPELNVNPYFNTCTLLQLLTHTSTLAFDPPQQCITQKELLNFLQKWQSTSSRNLSWGYSNHAVELIRIALENNTHSSIYDLTQNRIAKPLQLKNFGYHKDLKNNANVATGYSRSGQKTKYWDHPYLIGTAGLHACNVDMLKILKFFLYGDKMSDSTKQALNVMKKPFFSVNETFSQGIIWQISSPYQEKHIFPSPRVHHKNNYREVHFECPTQKLFRYDSSYSDSDLLLEKTGTTHGFHAYIGIMPRKKIGITLMINQRMENAPRILSCMARATLKKLID